MSEQQPITVGKYLFGPCSRALMEELSETSDYWATVRTFIEQNENRNYKLLSVKQASWLRKIYDGLLDEAGKAI